MLESIINFINLKLELTNYLEKQHCLTSLVKNDSGLIYPAEYIGEGDFDAVDFDQFDGVSYLRLNGEIDVARIDQKYTPKPRVNITFPLRLVYAVRKDKLTEDDAYSFDRVRGTIAKQLETDASDLVASLGVDLVQISTSGYNSDTQEVWSEETQETGQFQPKFEVVFGAMEVDVVVTAKADCVPTECDDVESDILKTFDFCNTSIQNRLTTVQVDCLRDWLCGVGLPVTIQLNGVTYTTAAAGSTFNQVVENSSGTPIGTAANPSIVTDSQAQVNGVNTETIPATDTHNQLIQDTTGSSVGTAANPSIVSDSQMTVHGTNVDVVPAEQSYDFRVKDSSGVNIGTHANPSIVSDTTIRNQANDWNDTEVAEGTYTLPYLRVVDSDGSNNDTVDYKPVADGAAFTCTPADYGTRILSVLRREYCVDALCGFSFRYVDDEWASAGNAVCRVRRSSDNSEQDFTPTEITDGTLTTFTGANDGHVVKFYDQTGNFFELFQSTAGSQAKLVASGVVNTDSSGNPTMITTSTGGYVIGANGSQNTRLTLFSPSGAFWLVGTKNNSTSISRMISAAGNPAVGIADTTSNPSDIATGTPTTYSNGSALADQLRSTLQTAINNNETAVLFTECDWTDSGNWLNSQGILAFAQYPVGSQISEFVLDKKDWSSATLVNLINSDLQTYYGYW